MALSITHTTGPNSNSVAARFSYPGKIITRPPWETRLRVLFCGNQKASSVDSASVLCSRKGNGLSIEAKFLFNIPQDPLQNNRPSALERTLIEIRETHWEVDSHEGAFRVGAREPVAPAADRPHKTSIVIGHEEGSVDIPSKILLAFSFYGIYLTKLESSPRPARRRMTGNPLAGGSYGLNVKQFEDVYYIDFEASMADRRAQNVLIDLQKFTTFVRVLGSYPADSKYHKI